MGKNKELSAFDGSLGAVAEIDMNSKKSPYGWAAKELQTEERQHNFKDNMKALYEERQASSEAHQAKIRGR
jgi:hypothetical protein